MTRLRIIDKWAVEIWTPYEGTETLFFEDAREALAFAKKEEEGGFSSATIRPETVEWDTLEFEEALNKGEIT